MTAAAPGAPDVAVAPLTNRQVVRRLLVLGAPPWGRFALGIGLGVAAALCTVGLLAASGAVVGRAALRPGLGAIAGLLALVEVLAVVRAPLRYEERLVSHDAAFGALTRWRVWLYDVLEPRTPAALGGWRSGDLLSRAIEDVDSLQDLYLRVLSPVLVAVGAAVLAVVVVGLVLPVAGAVLAVALLVAIVGAGALAARAGTMEGHEAARRGELAADVVELLQGAPELVAFGRQDEVLGRTEDLDRRLTALARRRALLGGAAGAVVVLGMGAAVVGVLVAGTLAVDHHHLPPVQLAILPLAAIGAFETVPALAVAVLRLGDVVAAGRRLLALEDVPVPVVDPADPDPLPAGVPAVDLDGVRLRYAAGLPLALDGLTLTVSPGQRLAVVGPSGSGKTSLVNLLLRFWPLDGGTARLGGVPLERLAQRDVRRAVALMTTDAHLFAGSIAHNVRLGRPDATDDEVAAALDLAQLTAWIASLPAGVGTPVGERGELLSGGQAQRVALARALVCGADVLVLDEPTAGLDRDTADRLVADVLSATGPRSLILVTHRDAEAAAFDDVAVLGGGRVAELIDRRGAPPSR
ncbi:MAG TPA: thiol reductant ABC exporter subunit CydC [Acidimicrobiales bacterium]|nr:thiol reductant ABC exporter subunit CydC [Acidimicrobiales bacterium]